MASDVYITAEEADGFIGTQWRNGDEERSVWLANVWLADRGVKHSAEIPDDVKRAGAELVALAAAGKLFADKQTGLLAETVRADAVSVSQSFAPDARVVSGQMQIVEALIRPYLSAAAPKPFVVPLLRG